MSNPTDTNQASEDGLDEILDELWDRAYIRAKGMQVAPNELTEAREKIQSLIRTEKLKLLDEVIHQSTINLKSAKAVAGWAELRKEQLEAEL